jgi:hypothetical protein
MTRPPKRNRRRTSSLTDSRPWADLRVRRASRAANDGSGSRNWPNPIQLLLGVGGIAAAILSIAGVISLLTPNEPPSPRGSFESVTADQGQGFREFVSRLETASLPGTGTGGRSAAYLASVPLLDSAQVAQSPNGTVDPGSTDTETLPPDTTDTETPPTDTTDTDTPSTDTTDTDTPSTDTPIDTEDGQVLDDLQSSLPPEQLPPNWRYKDTNGDTGLLLPRKDRDEAMSWLDPSSSAPGSSGDSGDRKSGEVVVAAKELLRVFRVTRRQPVSGSDKTEPVGAAVNFNLSLENLKGQAVVVRWSMYRAGAGSALPHDWLVNRRIFVEEIERSKHTVSKQFWVPLPRRPGPYFVRLSAWDGAERLDYQDSRPLFR